MRTRSTFILGALTAFVVVAGAAWAAMPAAVGTDSVVEVADAGTVTIERSATMLQVIEVDPATGWLHEIEVAAGREVEVEFRNGTRRIEMNAELEDGEVRVRVRQRLGDAVSSPGTSGDGPTSTTIDDTTSTSDASDRTSTTAHTTSSTANESTSTTVDDTTSTTIRQTTSTTTEDTTSTTERQTTSTTIDDDSSTSTTIEDSTSTTIDDNDGPAGSGSESYSVAGAATVAISWSDGRLTLVSVSMANGWKLTDQDLRSDRIELEFQGDGLKAEFEADFHHGSVRVETKLG